MNNHSEHNRHRPMFEHLPSLGDEAVWDLLELLYGLIDAYEQHYAEPLQRLRLERFDELHRPGNDEHQLHLSLEDPWHEPF